MRRITLVLAAIGLLFVGTMSVLAVERRSNLTATTHLTTAADDGAVMPARWHAYYGSPGWHSPSYRYYAPRPYRYYPYYGPRWYPGDRYVYSGPNGFFYSGPRVSVGVGY